MGNPKRMAAANAAWAARRAKAKLPKPGDRVRLPHDKHGPIVAIVLSVLDNGWISCHAEDRGHPLHYQVHGEEQHRRVFMVEPGMYEVI